MTSINTKINIHAKAFILFLSLLVISIILIIGIKYAEFIESSILHTQNNKESSKTNFEKTEEKITNVR